MLKMTLEDINDPKWAAYDKGAKKKKEPPKLLKDSYSGKDNVIFEDHKTPEDPTFFEENPSLDEIKGWAQETGELDDLILSMDWNITKTIFYERSFGKNILIRINFVEIRTDTNWYVIVPDILKKNPVYDPDNLDSKPFILKEGEDGPKKFTTQSRIEAEDYLWTLITRYNKIIGGEDGPK